MIILLLLNLKRKLKNETIFGDFIYIVESCPWVFLLNTIKYIYKLTKSLLSFSESIIKIFSQSLVNQPSYPCQSCGRTYKYKTGLSQHQRYECGKQAQFQCHLCPYKAKRKGSLRSHVLLRHNLSDQQT